MQFEPVASSNIKGVHYDPASKVMTIQFLSGQVHAYEDVSPQTHQGFHDADSKGKYFHAEIKSRHNSRKVETEQADGTAV